MSLKMHAIVLDGIHCSIIFYSPTMRIKLDKIWLRLACIVENMGNYCKNSNDRESHAKSKDLLTKKIPQMVQLLYHKH